MHRGTTTSFSQSMIIEHLNRVADRAETVTEPPEWESQTERVELKQVQRWSQEATRIEELMRESMPRVGERRACHSCTCIVFSDPNIAN